MTLGQADFRQLIPLLHPRTRIQDMDELKTWYEAVDDALRAELPADLLAIWLYGQDGEPLLLEPEALLKDNLEIPRATPIANQLQLDELEVRIRRAGYGSVLLRPIRHGGQDAGLILLASFPAHAYGMRAEALLESATDVMAPMLARVARGSGPPDDSSPDHSTPPVPEQEGPATDRQKDQARVGELLVAVSDAIGGADTPRDLMLALSFALQGILPHDSYELLISDSSGAIHYRLGLQGHGTLWGDSSLVISRENLDAARLFNERNGVLLQDSEPGDGPKLPELVTLRGPEEPPRSLVGVKLRVVERAVGYLLLGSNGPGFYGQEDLSLLDRVGALLAPRIESLVLAWQHDVLLGQLEVLRRVPMNLAQVAELLATTPFLGEGSNRFVELAGALLPLTDLEFAVRLADEQRVAVVKPGIGTPLADLPQEPIEGTGVGRVVRGEVPFLLSETEDENSGGKMGLLVVPLRTGGRIFGAMALTMAGATVFSRTDMALAQQLADLAAPHLDLARRTAASAGPFIPGWKRPTLRPERESKGP
jgi:GAF domain-containing protein